jgi:hypothetical protein
MGANIMPEYLAPGVYVEEVSFRAKSIEGLSTSVAGFIGPTRYGPTAGSPELLTSFADFERIYGGLDPLVFVGESPLNQEQPPQDNYMAHAVRAFFDNGGTKLYVTRVYTPTDADSLNPSPNTGRASVVLGTPPRITLRARFPGHAGEMRIVFAARLTANLLVITADGPRISGLREYDVIYIKAIPEHPSTPHLEGLYDVEPRNEQLVYVGQNGITLRDADLDPTLYRVARLTLTVRVRRPGRFEDEQTWPDLAPHPSNPNALTALFTVDPPSRSRYLTIPFALEDPGATEPQPLSIKSGAELAELLLGNEVLNQISRSLRTAAEFRQQARLSPPLRRPTSADLEKTYLLGGGSDGRLPIPEAYNGEDEGIDKTGLKSFEDVEEISIVAAPGFSVDYQGDNQRRVDQIVQYLLIHCQVRMRYRVAVLDSPNNQIVSEIQDFRGKFDSTHAALYYPWITILDPLDPNGRREIEVPPSGFVAGIYARTDVLHGVFKAPANEVVLGAINFEFLLNKAQQDVLNPAGINCFRFFEGRGFRLWGARTISSDPEWKYISVRRYFAYLEHSIDKGTQWAVFENNDDRLWGNVRQTVSDFLFNEWRNGALLGIRPEEAFFVRCDRSTMTQNDLDNGRLICLIGVAVVKPAEFVIFRIGQFTADRKS